MDKRFRYHQKHVHDLRVEGSVVRLWDAEGAVNRDSITDAFRPLMALDFVWPYAALMPDHHPGEGSMIGSVIPTRSLVLPSVVGGDLGCGMTATQLPVQAEEIAPYLSGLQCRFRACIPVGTSHNPTVTDRVRENPVWNRQMRAPILDNRTRRKMQHQFASLGGGNHFLEIQSDQGGQVWVMLHSGSRYLGVRVRDYYVERGQREPRVDPRLYGRVPHLDVSTPLAQDYLHDMRFVLEFARESRREMMIRALEVLAATIPPVRRLSWEQMIERFHDVPHNFVQEEEHFGDRLFVHRKGAICLAEGEVGLIPGSMGTRSYVVAGRGNAFGFNSCSHGAGRDMSRGDAFRTISDRQFAASMEGIVHQHDPCIKDEAPAAYKDIRWVMRGQKDLVKVLFELHPLLSVKGLA